MVGWICSPSTIGFLGKSDPADAQLFFQIAVARTFLSAYIIRMNLTKSFAERIETQLAGLDGKCMTPRVLPVLLAEAEAAAEAAGNALIDGLTQKRVLKAFTDSYRVNQSVKTDALAAKSERGTGAQPPQKGVQ